MKVLWFHLQIIVLGSLFCFSFISCESEDVDDVLTISISVIDTINTGEVINFSVTITQGDSPVVGEQVFAEIDMGVIRVVNDITDDSGTAYFTLYSVCEGYGILKVSSWDTSEEKEIHYMGDYTISYIIWTTDGGPGSYVLRIGLFNAFNEPLENIDLDLLVTFCDLSNDSFHCITPESGFCTFHFGTMIKQLELSVGGCEFSDPFKFSCKLEESFGY